MSDERHIIRASPALLRRLERGSSQSYDRLANVISSRNTQTGLGIDTTVVVTYMDEVIRAFPRGYWRLGETSGTTAFDDSYSLDALDFNGTYTGSYVLNAAGAISDGNGAVQLTGGYVTIGSASVFDTLRTESFGVEMWVKPTGSTNGALVSNVNNGTTTKRGWEVAYDATINTITFHLAADQAGGNRLAVTTTHNLDDGNYHHLWVMYEGTSTPAGVKIYVDNTLKTNTTVSNTLSGVTTSGNNLILGGRVGGPYTLVTLDDVAVYKATHGPEYVDWHYKAGQGLAIQR